MSTLWGLLMFRFFLVFHYPDFGEKKRWPMPILFPQESCPMLGLGKTLITWRFGTAGKINRGMKWCKQVMENPTSFPKDHAISFDNKNKSTEESVLLECWGGSRTYSVMVKCREHNRTLCYWRHPSSDVLPLTISYWWLQQRQDESQRKIIGRGGNLYEIFPMFEIIKRGPCRGLGIVDIGELCGVGFVRK